MKISGGYLPRIGGRPLGVVQDTSSQGRLKIDLVIGGIRFAPSVVTGQRVTSGEPIASAEATGGTIHMPAPAGGTVTVQADATPAHVIIDHLDPDMPCPTPVHLDRMDAESLSGVLAAQGVWPFIWSSRTNGMPAVDGSERPQCIIVNCVTAEPFRARGSVVLQRNWARIVQGLAALPRLMEEYGKICMTLTDASSPIVQLMKRDLAGHAWIRFESVPLRYPVEHPVVLTRAMRETDTSLKRNDILWVIDIQTILRIGTGLTDGFEGAKRIVAIGGPGEPNPRHVCVRVGTPLRLLIDEKASRSGVILRGGLFTGEPVDWEKDSIRYDDDAFFVLPRPKEREFLSFVSPGFDRVSYTPCFATTLTRGVDKHITTSLRGEGRPCIGCGNCEEVCPVDLLPQVIHRYLYRDAIDEAEAAGLPRCLLCGLCTFVCPSKIELQRQFSEMLDRLRKERLAQAEAEAKREQREESKKSEAEHSEDWRK